MLWISSYSHKVAYFVSQLLFLRFILAAEEFPSEKRFRKSYKIVAHEKNCRFCQWLQWCRLKQYLPFPGWAGGNALTCTWQVRTCESTHIHICIVTSCLSAELLPVVGTLSYILPGKIICLHFPSRHYVQYFNAKQIFKKWGSAVGIATGCGLNDQGNVVPIPEVGNFHFISSTPSFEPSQPPTKCVMGPLSSVVKRQERESGHSLPTSAKVKKAWIYTSIPPYAFMALCFISYVQEELCLFYRTDVQIEHGQS
jgi:hypothetical protein